MFIRRKAGWTINESSAKEEGKKKISLAFIGRKAEWTINGSSAKEKGKNKVS